MKTSKATVGFLAGLVIGVGFVSLGFWKTLFVLAVGLLGFILGYSLDRGISFWEAVEELVSKLRGKS